MKQNENKNEATLLIKACYERIDVIRKKMKEDQDALSEKINKITSTADPVVTDFLNIGKKANAEIEFLEQELARRLDVNK
jgi:hypothetical protein